MWILWQRGNVGETLKTGARGNVRDFLRLADPEDNTIHRECGHEAARPDRGCFIVPALNQFANGYNDRAGRHALIRSPLSRFPLAVDPQFDRCAVHVDGKHSLAYFHLLSVRFRDSFFRNLPTRRRDHFWYALLMELRVVTVCWTGTG